MGTESKSTISLQIEGIPAELKERPQWVTWKLETRNGKPTKVPYQGSTGRRAQTSDSNTWCSFEQAKNALQSGRYSGLGFVFTEVDPYTGVDFDHAIDEHGKLYPWAEGLLKALPAGGFVELSPSGRGLHAIVRAHKPGKKCRVRLANGGIEIYDQGRYFTVTGQLLPGAAPVVLDAQPALDEIYSRVFEKKPKPAAPLFEGKKAPPKKGKAQTSDAILAKMFGSRNGESIRALWEGSILGYGSPSEADLALCSHLWYWTDGDRDRVDQLFRQSGLMRDKWERHDYREATLDRASQQLSRPTSDRSISKTEPPSSTSPPFLEGEPPIDLDPADAPQRLNSHRANAWRLAHHYGGQLRHAHAIGFMVYDGKRWTPSDTQALGLASRISRHVCEEAAELSHRAAQTEDTESRKALQKQAEMLNGWARTSEQGTAIRESLKLATPLLRIDAGEFDTHPYLINLQNGTYDLQDHEFRSHSPEDFLTKMAPVWFNESATAPQWKVFLDQILGGSTPLVEYLQKALGYCITGSVQEQCLFFAYGQGQNGKSTLLDVLQMVLGSCYVSKAAPGLLLAKRNDSQPSEIADLQGARVAISQEVAQGRDFDIQRLKELTGERTLKARRLYKDWFEFPVQFKLWLAANHRPIVRDNSLAFWRRIHLIPFTQTIENPDRDLPRKLEAEKPGILNWLIQGATRYLDEGLDPPPEVREAVQDYRDESDSLGLFISENCEQRDEVEVKATEFWKAYDHYTHSRDLRRIRRRDLRMEMLNRGFTQPPRRGDGYYYRGLALKALSEATCPEGQ